MKRYVSGLLMVVLAGACEADDTKESLPDASVLPDGSMQPDASGQCETQRAALHRFLDAHRDCSADADCALIDACGGSVFAEPVSASARTEAQAMSDAISCKLFDGPSHAATCELGRCVARPTGGMCGGISSVCQSEHLLYQTSCTDAGTPESDCYKKCSGVADASCPAGFSCQATRVVPVTGGCAAPQVDAFLCRPAPSCEVALSMHVEAAPDTREFRSYSLHAGTSTPVSINLWAENLTDAPKSFRYGPRCVGHNLTGLGTYDAFSGCLAGACPTDQAPREVMLAPHERVLLGTGTVRAGADDCNPSGLARGSYDVGFVLEQVEGAAVCGPEALQLRVN